MEKRPDTSARLKQRRYERRNKEKRHAMHKVWGTSIERSLAEEIDTFLIKNNISKVELIKVGYERLKNKVNKVGIINGKYSRKNKKRVDILNGTVNTSEHVQNRRD